MLYLFKFPDFKCRSNHFHTKFFVRTSFYYGCVFLTVSQLFELSSTKTGNHNQYYHNKNLKHVPLHDDHTTIGIKKIVIRNFGMLYWQNCGLKKVQRRWNIPTGIATLKIDWEIKVNNACDYSLHSITSNKRIISSGTN